MKIGNNELAIDIITNNDENINKEIYQLSNIISPIFGLDHQRLISAAINVKKNNSASLTINKVSVKKSEENIFTKKEVAYNDISNLDNSTINFNKKKVLLAMADDLLSQDLIFTKPIDKKNIAININNLNNNDTVITTIDLLIADILDEK